MIKKCLKKIEKLKKQVFENWQKIYINKVFLV